MTTYSPGDRVRVIAPLTLCDGELSDAFAQGRIKVGDELIVAQAADSDGDIYMRTPSRAHFAYGKPEQIELWDKPAPAPASLRVDVRLFIGDRDVTDALGALLGVTS